MSHNQSDWTELLTIGEYAYNTRMEERQDFTSYQLVYEETPEITVKKEMIHIHNKIIEQRQTIREETRESSTSEYKRGNWVFLKRNSERKDRSSQTLDHKYWGSFQIKRQVNEYFYELDLSKSMKVHPIFGTHRLKIAHGQQHQRKEPTVLKDQQEYEVEKITREQNGQFRVK